MCEQTISDLESVVSVFIPEDHTYVTSHLKKLTTSGENYGSLILSVDLVTRDDHNEEHHIYAVLKKPPTNSLVQEMFNSRCTFPNEVGFYQKIVPCMQQFQKQQGLTNIISCFPEFYSSRVDLDPSGNIEESSLLLIKNTKIEGFDILDRTIGFDFPQALMVLEKMSEMHATIIALKLHNPEVFREEIVPFFAQHDTFVMDDSSNEKMIKAALDAVKDDEICSNHLPHLEELMHVSCLANQKRNPELEPQNPFSSLVHSDMWTNNIMLKIVDGETVDVKFIDFQLYEYTSLTRDVIFFVYGSVTTDVLREKCDVLLTHYHRTFIDWLRTFNCDVQDFSLEAFLQDMATAARKFEFFHIMTMLAPIYAASKDTKEVEQLEMESFTFYDTEVTETHREKAIFVVRDFIRRGWVP